MAAPLEGLKVVELARILAGPWIGQTLADLGADVIKLESPQGDDTRSWGPPFIDSGDDRSAAYFHACNRGKRSIVVDLNRADDLDRVIQLIATADVLIENFRAGSLKRFGLDFASVEKLNPAIIYCSVTGYGQNGTSAKLGGYDFIIQGLSGIMDLTGEPDQEPQKIGVAFADLFAALYGVIGIQAALEDRRKTNRGQHIDIALLDCMIGVLANQAMNYLVSGTAPTRLGNTHPNIVPYRVFSAADGHIVIACGNDSQFLRLTQVLELPEIRSDARFRDNASRVQHREALETIIGDAVSRRTKADLITALQGADVPAGPVNTVAEAFDDPQVRYREMVTDLDGIPSVRTPLTFSRSTLATLRRSPSLGEHNSDSSGFRKNKS